eukprot:TRINITY_DN10220_c0_g2_i3.p1 TRINITY_DN10220_c0_g2~~TRINITY_DN10220_c0_g2_i3.p1  ORF type:complete len:141 (+),score=20.32 TRINITY_DN10220_c0_g2_i3:139-561(+)
MIRRPPRSTLSSSSAASDVYKRQVVDCARTSRVVWDRHPSKPAPGPEGQEEEVSYVGNYQFSLLDVMLSPSSHVLYLSTGGPKLSDVNARDSEAAVVDLRIAVAYESALLASQSALLAYSPALFGEAGAAMGTWRYSTPA